jgi:hypothetical protein
VHETSASRCGWPGRNGLRIAKHFCADKNHQVELLAIPARFALCYDNFKVMFCLPFS